MEIKRRPKGFFKLDRENKTLQFTRLTYTTLPQLPDKLRNFDKLNRKQRSSVYQMGEQNPLQFREQVLFVRDRSMTNLKIEKADYFKFLSSLISNGIKFRVYAKGDLAAIVCYEESPVFSYENVDTKKLITAMEEMEYKVSVFDNIPGLEKGKGIKFDGEKFRCNLDNKLMKRFHGKVLNSVLKQIHHQLGKNRFGKSNFDNRGGLNFTLKGEEFRMAEPTRLIPARQVIQGDQSDIHIWLKKHLKDNPYDKMLVVGGIKPEGFTELNIDEFRTDFIKIIHDNKSDKEMWLGVFQVMEKAYLQNNLTTNMAEVIKDYFEHLNNEMIDVIDIYSFMEEIPVRSSTDYITIALMSTFDRYNHLQMMGKGVGELPDKIFLPMDGNMQDFATTIALLLLFGEENAEFINFVLINDSNLSDFLVSGDLVKVFEKIFSEITVIYTSNYLQQNLFLKMDKLILKHNNSSRNYVQLLYEDPLLWITPVFISRDDEIIWIDRPEKPVLAGHQLLFEFHPDYDRIFNSNINNFEEMVREVVQPQEEPVEENDQQFFSGMSDKEYVEDETKEETPLEGQTDREKTEQKSTENETGHEPRKQEKAEQERQEATEKETKKQEEPEKVQEYREHHIPGDVDKMAEDFEEKPGEDLDSVIEEFKKEFGFKKYLEGIGGTTVDAEDQKEKLGSLIKFFEIINIIKRSLSDQLELSRFDHKHHEIIDFMEEIKLVKKERIDENITHIILTSEANEMFSKITKTAKSLREGLKENQDTYFKYIDQISDANRDEGSHTITKMVISMAQLYSSVYLGYSRHIPAVLLATFKFWEEQIMDKPDDFVDYLDSKYLQSLQAIKREIITMRDKPVEGVKVADIPKVVDNKPVVDKTIDGLQPMVQEKSYYIPAKKKPKERDVPEGSTDINEMLKDVPIDKTPKKKPRRNIPPKSEEKLLTMAEARERVSQREYITNLAETENRTTHRKVMMSEEVKDMKEVILNLPLLDLKLSSKIKRILVSNDICYIDQFIDFDPSTLGFTPTMRTEVGELQKQIKKRIEKNNDYHDILMKTKLDFFVSLGGRVEKEFLSKHVVYRMPENVKERIIDNIDESETKQELLDNVYSCLMELTASKNHDMVDNLLRQLQSRNNPMLYDGEFSDFSVSWLYSTITKDTSLEEIKKGLKNKVLLIHINNNIDNRFNIKETHQTDEMSVEKEEIENQE